MRHTYADTSLARARLGFAPTVGSKQGLAAEYQWLTGTSVIISDTVSAACPRSRLSRALVARRSRVAAGCAHRRGRGTRARRHRASPTSSCSTRAPRR